MEKVVYLGDYDIMTSQSTDWYTCLTEEQAQYEKDFFVHWHEQRGYQVFLNSFCEDL